MNGPVTYEVLSYLIMGIIGALGLTFTAFWKIWSLIEKGKTDAEKKTEKLDEELSEMKAAHADFRTHIAETYVTKAGMQEQTGQLLRAIESIGKRIDGLNDRLDRLYDSPAPGRRTRSIQS
ncbi:hypothetical protein thsrh120_22410 [Rhizobium sp. No.120]